MQHLLRKAAEPSAAAALPVRCTHVVALGGRRTRRRRYTPRPAPTLLPLLRAFQPCEVMELSLLVLRPAQSGRRRGYAATILWDGIGAHKGYSHTVQGAAQRLAWSQNTLGQAPRACSLRGIIHLAMPGYSATTVVVIIAVKRQR